jgi:hypothetical protein
MDVLLEMNVIPPVVHQPCFWITVGSEKEIKSIEFCGFIGSDVDGHVPNRPDLKYTSMIMYMNYDPSELIINYRIEKRQNGIKTGKDLLRIEHDVSR